METFEHWNTSLVCYMVFIKYCVFFRFVKNIPDSGLSLFSLGVRVCTHTRQVENQRCSRTDRVKKNHKILREKKYLMNTLYVKRILWIWTSSGVKKEEIGLYIDWVYKVLQNHGCLLFVSTVKNIRIKFKHSEVKTQMDIRWMELKKD